MEPLRKLKYQLSKSTLDNLYCTYIRPLLEYGSEVWDDCSINDANRLEQVQLNEARIVTGLPVFASLHSLYYETGWEILADRRKRRKLILIYIIVNRDAPSYPTDFFPNRVNDIHTYNLRNRSDFEISFSRFCSYDTSYFPSTLRLWIELGPQTCALLPICKFSSNIQIIPDKIADYTNIGELKNSIMLARIRHRCSSLNRKEGSDHESIQLLYTCHLRHQRERRAHQNQNTTSRKLKGQFLSQKFTKRLSKINISPRHTCKDIQ